MGENKSYMGVIMRKDEVRTVSENQFVFVDSDELSRFDKEGIKYVFGNLYDCVCLYIETDKGCVLYHGFADSNVSMLQDKLE